jgi:hypothetical protein
MNLEDLGFSSNLPGRGVHIVSTYQGCGAGVPCNGLAGSRPIKSGQYMGSLGLAGHRPRHVQDLVALQVAGVGRRGFAGLGATASGSASGESSSTDWAAIIAAATGGAANIIDSAKADANPPASTSTPLYQPMYHAPAPTPPPAPAATPNYLPFAALVVGGVLGALVARSL